MGATEDCNLCNSYGFVIAKKCGHTISCPYCGGVGQFGVDWIDDGPLVTDRSEEVEKYRKDYLPIYDEEGNMIDYEDHCADWTIGHD